MNDQHKVVVNHGCGPARSYLATLRPGVVIPGAEDLATGLPWYVVRTTLRQEQPACDNLVRQGYAVYLPRMKVLKRSRGRHQAQLEPLFPHYLFVQPGSHAHSLARVRCTLGVTTIVRFGRDPAALRPETIGVFANSKAVGTKQGMKPSASFVPAKECGRCL